MRNTFGIWACWLSCCLLAGVGWAQDDEPAPKKKKPASSSKSGSSGKKPKKEADDKSESGKTPKPPREPQSRQNYAEPTDKKPQNLLNVHEDRDVEVLADELEDLHVEIHRAIQDLFDKKGAPKAKNAKISSKDMLAVGHLYGRMLRADTLANRLRTAGEPLGWDLTRRLSKLNTDFQNFFGNFSAQQAVKDQLGAARTQLDKDTKAKAKLLPQVDKLIAADRLREADELLADAITSLHRLGVYFDPKTRPYSDLLARQVTVDNKLIGQLKTTVQATALKSELAPFPDFQGLLKQVDAAKSAVGTSGKFDGDGESLTGPAALARLGAAWRKLQFAAVRRQSWEFAYMAAGGSDLASLKLQEEQKKFHQAMCAGLAALIEADAARAGSDEAGSLYPQYVQELAVLNALGTDDSLEKAVAPALAKLADKSPQLKSDVAAYQAATDDLLRWRRRTAADFTRRRAAEFPPLEDRVWEANGGAEGVKLGLSKRTRDQARVGNGLTRSTDEVLELLNPVLLKQKLTAADLLGPRTETAWKTSNCYGFAFCRLPQGSAYTAAVEQLSADLLVTPALWPLSLPAATALESARHGDLDAAGGEVTELGFHAMIPRLNRILDEDWGLVRLSSMPSATLGVDLGQRVFLRCDMQPAWVQPRYFYLKLAPEGQLSQNEAR